MVFFISIANILDQKPKLIVMNLLISIEKFKGMGLGYHWNKF